MPKELNKYFFKIIKIIAGLLLLILIQYLSNLFLTSFKINFPSPLFGMIILSLLLHFQLIKESFIKDIADILLKNMSLFFVPLFVGVVSFSRLIKSNFIPIIILIIFATLITMISTALFVDKIIKITSKENQE